MVLVLGWNYKVGTDELLDKVIKYSRFNNLVELANGTGLALATLNRKLKRLKNNGLLVSHRYKDNNIIWCIGKDVKYNAWEAYQIAKYRLFVNMGGDTVELDDATDEERENMLIDIPVFDSEKEEAMSDAGYGYMQKVNKILNAKGIDATQELKDYVDELWSKM